MTFKQRVIELFRTPLGQSIPSAKRGTGSTKQQQNGRSRILWQTDIHTDLFWETGRKQFLRACSLSKIWRFFREVAEMDKSRRSRGRGQKLWKYVDIVYGRSLSTGREGSYANLNLQRWNVSETFLRFFLNIFRENQN